MSVSLKNGSAGKVSGLRVGWGAVAAVVVAWGWYNRDPQAHTAEWGVVTIAALAVSAGLVVLAAVGTRRDAGSGRAPIAATLAVVVWFLGFFLYLAVAFIGYGTACEGTSAACSWECLNASGSSWQTLSWLCVGAALVAVPTLLVVSREVGSRVVARVAAPLVIVLFLAAMALASPHGDNTRCEAAASSRPCATAGPVR